MKTGNRKSLIQEVKDEYKARARRLKRKKFLLKARLMLTVVLPVLIVLLAVKVIKTFVQLKVRSLFAKPKEALHGCGCKDTAKAEETAPVKPAAPVPAEMKPVEKEIIKPVPVAGDSGLTGESF